MNYKYLLVLVPGLDGTGDLFKPFLKVLPKELNTLTIRYPKDKVLTFEEIVEVVNKQIPKNQSIIILAESFAGPVVLNLMKNYKIDVEKIIFCTTFSISPRKKLLTLLKVIPLNLLLHLSIPNVILKYFCVGKDASKELVDLVKEVIKIVKPEVLASRLRMLVDIDERNSLSGLSNIDCFYIQASEDKLIPNECIDDFVDNIPTLKVKVINGSHFIIQAKPDECWSFIKTAFS